MALVPQRAVYHLIIQLVLQTILLMKIASK